MNVTATADVKFLEIQNVGTNFTGGTIAVDADKAGSKTDYKLSPVTPMQLTATDKTGTEKTVLDVKTTGTNGTDGYGDGLAWKWTTASSGTASTKGTEAEWKNADGTAYTGDTANFGLINTVAYQEVNGDEQAVKVFVYYEGDDAELYTANLNSLKGVTANITFTTR